MNLKTLYFFTVSVVNIFNFSVCNIMCYKFQAICGHISYKEIPRMNVTTTGRRLAMDCYSMCKSTPNCDGVNLCRRNQDPYCEIVFDDENEKFPCQNVDATNNDCKYYKLIPMLDIPDDARAQHLRILQTDNAGNVISGSKSDLKTKLFDGGDVIAVIKNWENDAELLVNVDIVLSYTAEVCFQTNWNILSFESENVMRTIVIVCTNGHIRRQDWRFGVNQKLRDVTVTSAVDWFVRHVATTNNSYTVNTPGYPEEITTAVKSGKIITLVSAPLVLYTKNAIIQNTIAFSYNLWELAVTKTNGVYTFKNLPYWFSSVIRSNNRKLVGRWELESSNIISFSSYAATSLNYVVDIYWQSIAKTNKNGERIDGSLNKLNYFVRNGHRLRVYVNNYALEGIHTLITNNIITVMNFGSLKLSGDNLDTSMILIMGKFSTNGSAYFYHVPIGSNDVNITESSTFEMEWFVDIRQWNFIYSTQKFVEDENSYVSVFRNVIDSGDKLRLSWLKEDEEEIFTIDTLINKGSDYQAFTVKNVKIASSKVYYNFFSFAPNGTVQIRTIRFGNGVIHHQEDMHNQNLTWFSML